MLRWTASVAALLVVLCGTSRAVQDPPPPGQTNPAEVHQTYDIGAGGLISISNISGYIRVTSWDENRVRVDAVKRGPRIVEFDQVEIQVVSKPQFLSIKTISSRRSFEARERGNSVSVDYDVKVPRSAVLNSLVSVSGEVRVTGPVAQLTARSVSGAIEATEVHGITLLNSSSGSIRGRAVGGQQAETIAISHSGAVVLEQVAGRVNARSLAGSVSVVDVGGDVSADSTSGSVVVDRVRGRVDATSIGGKVMVRNVEGGVTARAVGGSIEISEAKGRVGATTMSGGVSLRNVESREVVAKSTSGSVTFDGRIMLDGRYSFESFSGLIVVVIPPESQFSLTAKTFNGSINTEFPIEVEPGSIGGDRLLRGMAGKGGAEIVATGFNGRIEIKKAKTPSTR